MNSLLIDGIESDLRKFVNPTMGLSSSRAIMNRHSFQLRLDKAQLICDFTGRYEKWFKESKLDDEKQGGADLDDIIGLAGYPEISQILKDENMAEMLFGWYLVEDVFEKYCCTNYENINYWFDTTESVSISDDWITIHGICYSE